MAQAISGLDHGERALKQLFAHLAGQTVSQFQPGKARAREFSWLDEGLCTQPPQAEPLCFLLGSCERRCTHLL